MAAAQINEFLTVKQQPLYLQTPLIGAYEIEDFFWHQSKRKMKNISKMVSIS